MRILGFDINRERRNASPENASIPLSAENFLAFFGVQTSKLPHVTIDHALTVPAVAAAVAFLSRTLAALPLHAYRMTSEGPTRLTGRTAIAIHESPNELMDSVKFRQYFWQQVFTGGRGLAWIERNGTVIERIWPMDPSRVTVRRSGFDLIYSSDGREYPAADVIDVPFMLKVDQISHYGPISLASKAIQLALAMNDYASNFFAGGGVPPLALTGPLPTGGGLQRAMADIHRAINEARKSDKPVFPMPPGHELKAVGFDPEKGQMTEARLFQVQEVARAYQLPPNFLQDLSRATFSNVEQNDLYLVKHLVGQWAALFEGELNLKLFGRNGRNRYVEHNLNGLMRGDFKSRIEGIARGIQTGQMTPNEARALEGRPRHGNVAADELLVQGATVVLGSAPAADGQTSVASPDGGGEGDGNDDDA